MSNVLKYPALNAKMKGMYSRNLNKEELEEMMRQNSLKDAISFLKSKFPMLDDVSEAMSRKELEQKLNNLFIIDTLKLYKYLDKNELDLFRQFILKYELNCVKNVFRNLTTNRDVKINLKNIDDWTSNVFQNIENINNVDTEEEFLEIIKNEKYYKFFQKYENIIEDVPLEDLETQLDKFYFQEIFKYSKKVNLELNTMIGYEIDLLNIVWIYRAKIYFGYSEDNLREIIIPIYYKLNSNKINKLIEASDFEEMKNVLKNTIYKNVFKNEENIEIDKSKFLYKIYIKYFRNGLFNICSVFAYMNLVEFEIKNIINIIEGIRYKADINEMQKRIIV